MLRSPAKRRKTETENKTVCILCKESARGKQLYGTDSGRKNLVSASQKCQDDLLKSVDTDCIFYHIECYRPYILKASRVKDNVAVNDSVSECEIGQSDRVMRCRKDRSTADRCIVCDKKTSKGDSKLYRICESDRACDFLSATKCFQDEVYSRTSTLSDVSSVFANDITYHSKCMSSYLLKHRRHIDRNKKDEEDDTVAVAFEKLLKKFVFPSEGYVLSDLCSFMNEECNPKEYVTNKQLKNLLINHFGEEILFAYSKERNKSQVVFSSHVKVTEVVDNVRHLERSKLTAEKLRKMFREYDFQLHNKFCDEEDLKVSLMKLQESRPKEWEQFMSVLLPTYETSLEVQRKSDVIFQIIYHLLLDGNKKNPITCQHCASYSRNM